ncbi:MAG TPA: class I SAM-dependent methyltransferase [Candidatus Saccharimonadales bacterium]|nr:class I SAM-dependent methyltransferase [Candidatus Saccharimonadales bacterium]
MKNVKNDAQEDDERMVPELHKGHNIYGEHIIRYEAAVSLIKNKIVLDIASGSGYGTKLMAKSAKKVYGVDVSKGAVDYAKAKFSAANIEYLVGDGEKIPLGDHIIDVVVCCETIEHIKDYKQFLNEVKRVLKPGGTLLLSTPNDIEYIEGNHFHLHEFTYQELKDLVKKYFKYHKDYFQTIWLYNTLFPRKMHTSEWKESIQTMGTVPLKEEQCLYFFMVCSDSPITQTIEPLAAIGEHYRLRSLQQHNKNVEDLHRSHDELVEQRSQLWAEKAQLEKDRDSLSVELETIKNSRSWKLARKLAGAKSKFAKKPKDEE